MDVGGFAAAIYMRGISKVTLIPTTMLGMVDATVGGKMAVNFGRAKNVIGGFRNPNVIIVCTEFLKTQSERQFFNGMVETIKMALTYDK
jgi:3-dehydroquinate synthetase